MPRAFAITAVLLAAGCTHLPPPSAPPVEGLCNEAAANGYIGSAPSQAVGQEIMRATGAKVLRWLAPGTMVTMEFSPTRVNVHYGNDYRISRIACG